LVVYLWFILELVLGTWLFTCGLY